MDAGRQPSPVGRYVPDQEGGRRLTDVKDGVGDGADPSAGRNRWRTWRRQIEDLEQHPGQDPRDVNVPRLMRTIGGGGPGPRMSGGTHCNPDNHAVQRWLLSPRRRPPRRSPPRRTGPRRLLPRRRSGQVPRRRSEEHRGRLRPADPVGTGEATNRSTGSSPVSSNSVPFLVPSRHQSADGLPGRRRRWSSEMRARVFVLNGDSCSCRARLQTGGE